MKANEMTPEKQKSDVELLSKEEILAQVIKVNLDIAPLVFDKRIIVQQALLAMSKYEQQIKNVYSLKSQQLQATVDELKGQLTCDVCLGSAMENCACNGTGSILTAITTIRQINFKLQQRCEELEKAAKRMVKFIDPEKHYPVSYVILQDGSKIYEAAMLKGKDLTEKQIIQLFIDQHI